jgi:hypothetical protein
MSAMKDLAWQSLIHFIGYGSLSAPFWFLGPEESLGDRPGYAGWSPEWELRVRSGWSALMDAREAHRQLRDEYWSDGHFSSVWRVAAQLTRGFLGNEDWRDPVQAKQYILERLGHAEGETLLGELFPLPTNSLADWPYSDLFPDRDTYFKAVLSTRKILWTEAIRRRRPKILCCYGKGGGGAQWRLYQEIAGQMEWTQLNHSRVMIGQLASTQIFLLPFFGQGQYRLDDLAAVIDLTLP